MITKILFIAILVFLFGTTYSQNAGDVPPTPRLAVKQVRLTNPPDTRYPGSGAMSLVDGLIGSSDPRDKQWMGWQGNDFEATVDLGVKKEIHRIGLDVMQLPASAMYLPTLIEYSVSADGKIFTQIGSYNPADVDDIRKNGPVLLSRTFDEFKTRFVRIKVVNFGTIPSGQPDEGKKAWLLVSEIEIE